MVFIANIKSMRDVDRVVAGWMARRELEVGLAGGWTNALSADRVRRL
jgi:hypothetical protein